jgi:dUTP pyrophosphatase
MNEAILNYNIKIADDATMPSRAKPGDAGYDIVATTGPLIVGEQVSDRNEYHSIDYIEYKTGIYLDPEPAAFTLVFPRSSVSKYNLILCNCVGVVDNGYRGEVLLRFKYIWQPRDLSFYSDGARGCVNWDRVYKKGDKIGQLIPAKSSFINFNVVDTISNSVRGDGGFGSTGV